MIHIYKNNQKKIFIVIFMLFVVSVIGGMYAKYLRTVTLSKRMTISAQLADDVKLIEHELVYQNGKYELGEKEVLKNVYDVVPGADIPKDPQIIIEDKSVVDTYLYIEVVDTLPENSGISYQLTSQWIELDNLRGKHEGQIYVYSQDGNNPTIINNTNLSDNTIYIIESNKITVNENIGHIQMSHLDFYGYMTQVTNSDASAREIFDETFNKSI